MAHFKHGYVSPTGILFTLLLFAAGISFAIIHEAHSSYTENRDWLKADAQIYGIFKTVENSRDVEILGLDIPPHMVKYLDKNYRSPAGKKFLRALIPGDEVSKYDLPDEQFVRYYYRFKTAPQKFTDTSKTLLASDSESDALITFNSDEGKSFKYYYNISPGKVFTVFYDPDDPEDHKAILSHPTKKILFCIPLIFLAYIFLRFILKRLFKHPRFYFHLGDIIAIISLIVMFSWQLFYGRHISIKLEAFEKTMPYVWIYLMVIGGCLLYQFVFGFIKKSTAACNKKFDNFFESSDDDEEFADHSDNEDFAVALKNKSTSKSKHPGKSSEKISDNKWEEILSDSKSDSKKSDASDESYQAKMDKVRDDFISASDDFSEKPSIGKGLNLLKTLSKASTHHQTSKPTSYSGKSVWIIALILLVVNIGISYLIGPVLISKRIKVESFYKTQGELLESKLVTETDSDGDTTTSAHLRYVFKVHGKTYKGKNLTYTFSSVSGPKQTEFIKNNRPGDTVTVFYDPENPNESCLQKSGVGGVIMITMLVSIFALIGYYFLILIICRAMNSVRYKMFRPDIEDMRSGVGIPGWGKISTSRTGFSLKPKLSNTEIATLIFGVIFIANLIGTFLSAMIGGIILGDMTGIPWEYYAYYYAVVAGLAIVVLMRASRKGKVLLNKDQNLLHVVDFKNKAHDIPLGDFKRWSFEYYSNTNVNNEPLWSGMISLHLKGDQKILVRVINSPGNYNYDQLEEHLTKIASVMNKATRNHTQNQTSNRRENRAFS